MIITYPAVFKNNGDGYDVTFPDFKECVAYGENPVKAIEAAKKMLGAYAAATIESGSPLPKATDLDDIEVPENSYATYVEVNLKKFLTPTEEEIKAKKKKIRKILLISTAIVAAVTAAGVTYCLNNSDCCEK